MKTFQDYLEESLSFDTEASIEELKHISTPLQIYPVTVSFPQIQFIK